MDVSGMKIMSVDDNLTNLKMIEVYGQSMGIVVESYADSKQALEAALRGDYDLIIVDYMMPRVDGLTFIKEYRGKNDQTPIVMITAIGDDEDVHYKALERGANDFLKKPMNGMVFKLRIHNLLSLRKAQRILENRAKSLEEEVHHATKDILARELETLTIVGKTAEYKDPETGQHIQRVSAYSKILAKAYGLNLAMQNILFYATPLHDIGKVGIPDHILMKSGPLNEEEWIIMKQHPLIGYEILKKANSKYLNAGAIIAFSHHERYDGTGYPKGLKAEAIPLFGRIVAIADVFDALTSKRSYKEAWTFEQSVEKIKRESGHHFDPKLVTLFMHELEDIRKVYLAI